MTLPATLIWSLQALYVQARDAKALNVASFPHPQTQCVPAMPKPKAPTNYVSHEITQRVIVRRGRSARNIIQQLKRQPRIIAANVIGQHDSASFNKP